MRPESIYVQEEGGIYPGTCSSPVQGTVVSHQLLGNVIRYRIAALGTELTVDVMNRSSSRLYAPQTGFDSCSILPKSNRLLTDFHQKAKNLTGHVRPVRLLPAETANW